MEKIRNNYYLNQLLRILKSNYKNKIISFKKTKHRNSLQDDIFISPNIYTLISDIKNTYMCDTSKIRCYIHTNNLNNKIKKDIQLIINRFYTLYCILIKNNISFNKQKFILDYYPLKCKKVFPINFKILNPENINSGSSYIFLNKISIWREEEFLKVFIHELFHCLGFDRFLINNKSDLTKYFNIKNFINHNEGYNEFCALIYHCAFTSIENNTSFSKLLNKNREFTFFQIKQILQYNNYKNFDTNKLFKQNASVFSYFILKGFYLYHLNQLIDICKKDTFYFYPLNKFISFNQFELECFNNKAFYILINNLIKNFDYISNNTLRMTI